MLCLSGFEVYSRWLPMIIIIITNIYFMNPGATLLA